MSEVRITIQTPDSSTIPPTLVTPIWSGVIVSALEPNQVFYRKKFTQLKFKDDDYCLILEADECEKIEILIEEYCDFEWREYVAGKFTKRYDCEVNKDLKYILVTPTTVDLYTCFFEEWEIEQNIYNCSAEVSARGVIGTYQAGLFPCYECRATANPTPCNVHTDEACVQFSLIASYPSPKCAEPNRFEVNTAWHREVGVGTSTTPPPYGSGWTLLTGFEWWRCPDSDAVDLGVFRYGRTFQSAISYLIGQGSCNTIVRSHFFGMSATHPSPTPNDAYDFADTYLQNITIHQKSDVKRPDADKSQSKVWTLKQKDLLDDLRETFGLYWFMQGTIENPELVIEHISYFEDVIGLDVSNRKIARVYNQDDSGAPRKEIWKWADDTVLYFRHAGYPIEYGCGGGADLEHRVRSWTNDVVQVKASVNAENISDKGYVLLANYLADTGQRLIYERNDKLGFLELHDKLHRHNRYFENGTMNQLPQTFTTYRKTRKLAQFSTAVCCEDNFDASKLVLTSLGLGKIAQAGHNLIRNKVTLDLLI
jgi:hypothetical protein